MIQIKKIKISKKYMLAVKAIKFIPPFKAYALKNNKRKNI